MAATATPSELARGTTTRARGPATSTARARSTVPWATRSKTSAASKRCSPPARAADAVSHSSPCRSRLTELWGQGDHVDDVPVAVGPRDTTVGSGHQVVAGRELVVGRERGFGLTNTAL